MSTIDLRCGNALDLFQTVENESIASFVVHHSLSIVKTQAATSNGWLWIDNRLPCCV